MDGTRAAGGCHADGGGESAGILMNLVLIGYRGTGKTALSEQLRLSLNLPVYHMDEMLESRFGEKISSFVERCGWDSFREEERLLVEELTQMDGVVIDAGGGVIVRDDNIHDLRRNGFVVWLQASTQEIARRIGCDSNRPSLTGTKSHVDEIKQVLEQRRPRYEAASHFTLRTDELSFDECVERILKAWREKNEALAAE
ncbi:MAG: shikimate kinase [Candidatus Omnitrophota bacterium]